MTDRIAEPWGARTPYAAGQRWPDRVNTELSEGLTADEVDWTQSAAVLHSNGDGIDIAAHDGRIVGVRGRRVDRVNHGRVDPKDLFGWQANSSPDRLMVPLVRDDGRLVESDWDTAMNRIVSTTQALLRDIGPSAIGFYTSGQLLLEVRMPRRFRWTGCCSPKAPRPPATAICSSWPRSAIRRHCGSWTGLTPCSKSLRRKS